MRAPRCQRLWTGSTSMCALQVSAGFLETHAAITQLRQQSFLHCTSMHGTMKCVACRCSGIACSWLRAAFESIHLDLYRTDVVFVLGRGYKIQLLGFFIREPHADDVAARCWAIRAEDHQQLTQVLIRYINQLLVPCVWAYCTIY